MAIMAGFSRRERSLSPRGPNFGNGDEGGRIGCIVGGSLIFSGYIGLAFDDEGIVGTSTEHRGLKKLLELVDLHVFSSLGRVLMKLCMRPERYAFERESMFSGFLVLAGSVVGWVIVNGFCS